MQTPPFDLVFAFAPYRLSGTVYGVAVGHGALLDELGQAAHAPPYRAPPKSVVLYVKPSNTFARPGDEIEAMADGTSLIVGAALAVVIGSAACRVTEHDALGHVAGYAVAADFTAPVLQHYRPQVRAKARDRSLALSTPVAAAAVGDAGDLAVRVAIDGHAAHRTTTGGTTRSIARLVSEVSDFITLAPGDLLLAGVAPGAPHAGPGAAVRIDIDAVGSLHVRIASASAPPESLSGLRT